MRQGIEWIKRGCMMVIAVTEDVAQEDWAEESRG